jgi:hypothetical protein
MKMDQAGYEIAVISTEAVEVFIKTSGIISSAPYIDPDYSSHNHIAVFDKPLP